MPQSRSKYSEANVTRRKNMIRDILLGVLVGLAVIFVILAGRFIYGKSKDPNYRIADLFGITTAGTLPTLPTFPIDNFTLPSSSETLPETSSEATTEETADASTEETVPETTTEADTSAEMTETDTETSEAPPESSTEETTPEETTPEESTEETTPEETTPEETTPEETTPEESTEETTPEESTEETTPEESTTEAPVLTDPSDINYHLAHYNMDEQDLGDCRQLIVVHSSGTQCMLYFFDKEEKEWALSNAIPSAPGIVGENGVTTDKKEGDGCTPAGYFAVGPCYGEDEGSPTSMEYHQIVLGDYWVDDVESEYYNMFYHEENIDDPLGSWTSAEDLYHSLRYYRYMAVVRYNMDPVVPGAGSAVFLRCQADDTATAGSIGTTDATVFAIMRWLDPEADPHILIY